MCSVVPDESGYFGVDEGDEVKLPCHVTSTTATNVTWLYKKNFKSWPVFIYTNGQIYDRLRQRYGIYNATVGDYSLRIQNIQAADAGRYHCYNQRQQLLRDYHISVFG